MAIRGPIDHIDLTVTDYETSVPFYDRVLRHLGFTRLNGNPTPVWFMQYPGGAFWGIGLQLARPESRDKKHDRYAPGLHHIAFHAESRADVDATYELLREMGAHVLDPPADYGDEEYSPGYYAVFFADPDGLKLEVVHQPRANPGGPSA